MDAEKKARKEEEEKKRAAEELAKLTSDKQKSAYSKISKPSKPKGTRLGGNDHGENIEDAKDDDIASTTVKNMEDAFLADIESIKR